MANHTAGKYVNHALEALSEKLVTMMAGNTVAEYQTRISAVNSRGSVTREDAVKFENVCTSLENENTCYMNST